VELVGRLHPGRLAALPASVGRPRYDREALRCGIVHLGLGAFARAHLLAATDAALDGGDALDWGVCGVSMRSSQTRDALAPQQALYALAVRDADAQGRARQALSVIGCLRELLVAPQDPQAVLERIAYPETRIVSLTVTEKAYAHDLARPEAPAGVIGFLVHGLALRRRRGLAPVTLLSLDNLPGNGHLLRGLVCEFAHEVDPPLADWIAGACSFPNSMVDRIVPRTTDEDRLAVEEGLGLRDAWPVVCEPFFDWAVEDRFAAGRPDWPGVRFVDSAAPWERLKLRMVNGAHSAIAYLGAQAGWRSVDQAIGQPSMRRYVERLMKDEIEPTLSGLPGFDLDDYRARLLERFANPALAHRTRQIAMDGSQKLPQRLLGTVRDRLAAGASIRGLALAVAAWLHDLRGRDETGAAHAIDDPLASELQALRRRAEAAGSVQQRVRMLCGFAPVFGEDLGADARFVEAVADALRALEERGVEASLAAIIA
jgi:fructuronate reductase